MPAYLLQLNVCAETTLVSRETVNSMIVRDLAMVSYTEMSGLCYPSLTFYCVEYFNQQSNIFLAYFKHANSNIRNALFQNYSTSFYASQILSLFGNCMEDIYTAWRIAMRRVWRVP